MAESEVQSWTQVLSQWKLSESLRFWGEAQPRYSLETGKFTTLLLRPAIGWEIKPGFSVWLGYAWTPLFNPVPRDEHRFWGQVIYVVNPGFGTLTQRLRSETRLIEGVSQMAIRLRYQARFAIPVSSDEAFQLVTYDELFLALNSVAPSIQSGFDQNRLFFGAFHRLRPELAFDVGYMWNAVRNPLQGTTKSNHILMISIYLSA